MKLLLTVHQFYPDSTGGTETLTLDTAKELRRQGHEVTIFAGFHTKRPLQDEERFDSYEYCGFRVERFYHHRVPMGQQENIAEAEHNNTFFGEHFTSYLKRVRPDVVHFFHMLRMSASMVEACYRLDVPTVMTPTDFWLVCPTIQLLLPNNSLCAGPDVNSVNCLRHIVSLSQPRSIDSVFSIAPDWLVARTVQAVRRMPRVAKGPISHIQALVHRPDFLRSCFRKIDRVLVPSRILERTLKQNGYVSDNMVVSPYGIDLSHSYSERVFGSNDRRLRLGFIGTLYKHKGAHVLIRAIRSLPQSEAVELKVYGDTGQFPAYVQELKQVAGSDSRIEFCGTFPNSQIGAILASLDVLVVPSIWYENTPLVIYSAQAAGCPVIASNLGGMSEVVRHNDNGLLFAPGDASELASMIAQLARNRERVRQLSKTNKPKSISDYAKELTQVYADIVRQKREVRCAV